MFSSNELIVDQSTVLHMCTYIAAYISVYTSVAKCLYLSGSLELIHTYAHCCCVCSYMHRLLVCAAANMFTSARSCCCLVYAIDVDECAIGRDLCDQVCINTVGSYSCACSSGYEIAADRRTCKGELWQ